MSDPAATHFAVHAAALAVCAATMGLGMLLLVSLILLLLLSVLLLLLLDVLLLLPMLFLNILLLLSCRCYPRAVVTAGVAFERAAEWAWRDPGHPAAAAPYGLASRRAVPAAHEQELEQTARSNVRIAVLVSPITFIGATSVTACVCDCLTASYLSLR